MKSRLRRVSPCPLAVVLFLSFFVSAAFSGGIPNFPKNLPDLTPQFQSGRFQSAIVGDRSLSAMARENSAIGDPSTSFGFAEKSEEAKFFLVGALYSESVAYLKSGQKALAAKRLESIERELINLQAPQSLYGLLAKTKNVIQQDRYPAAVMEDFLALFQPSFEDFARGRGADKLTLFQAGTWLVDLGLAAAAGSRNLLQQQQTETGYFLKEMKRMDAPKGVLEQLEEIARITGQKEISDKDMEAVLRNVKKIQTTLG